MPEFAPGPVAVVRYYKRVALRVKLSDLIPSSWTSCIDPFTGKQLTE